ncbi:MAG: amidohydrolase family protein [Treponema sp.]|jgi:N-acyl-D-amino-acid deacylase|nr:amidohydrolase family protein [Treponema sp.]
MPDFDLVIAGARVLDPETGLDETLNVGLLDGHIAALTMAPLRGERVIEAASLVLSPGFIDIHTHEDFRETQQSGEFRIPRETSACALRSGTTTILGGNCGGSNYPVGNYLETLAAEKLPINCLTLAGNSTLRKLLGLDEYDTASPSQIAAMKDLAGTAMDEGARGISFGLQYAPGTSFAEVLALCEAVREKDKFFAVHMRYDTPSRAVETVEEVIAAARITGAALQISHYAANVYGLAKNGLSNIDITARLIGESGADITADVYPYDTWATGIRSAVFDQGFDDFNFKVTDLEILSGPLAGRYCTQEIYEELRHSPQETSVACHNATPMRDIEAAYRLPFVCLGSDANMTLGADGHKKGHPRAAGSPARFLREFVREKGLFSLMEGIRKLSLLPAQRLGLGRKGRLQEGCDADLCLFDPQTIGDRAAFGVDVCALPPTGIRAVIVGGKLAWEEAPPEVPPRP